MKNLKTFKHTIYIQILYTNNMKKYLSIQKEQKKKKKNILNK